LIVADKILSLAKLYETNTSYSVLLQATTIVPYPGMPLYERALKENGLPFDPGDYERFDMCAPYFGAIAIPQ